jgi:50S ribosomal protein L16 3-hydroxylase
MDTLSRLGDLSVDEFMRTHWQRRPRLIRAALPGFRSPIDPAGLFALAQRDDVESRLVSASGDDWRLEHGPFERLPPRRRKRWTLLVQGVDLHHDAAHRLLQRFRFVPDARLDDLMASFATDGGGVGPHVDSYDVFLLQAQGRRRWRLAPPGDGALRPDLPVRLLARFEPTEEWLLEAGDMLYLPPGWGHDGVAQGECLTLSIGFRAPSRHEFLSAFLAASAESVGGPDPRFTDRGRSPTRQPGRLPADLAERLRDWALAWRPSAAAVDRFVGCFVTEPKPTVWFEPPAPTSVRHFEATARRQGLVLDRRSRIAWRGGLVYLNGEAYETPRAGRRALRELADRRALPSARCAGALDDGATAVMLHRWHAAGWIRTGATDRGDGQR